MITLKELRETRGWSQVEFARRARVGPAEVSRIERGLRVPYQAEARRLARALGISDAQFGDALVEGVRAWVQHYEKHLPSRQHITRRGAPR